MSYILDALRRADAERERERGAVPGLHARGLPADTEPAARDFRPLLWAAGGAGALLVAVVLVLVFGPWRAQPGAAIAAVPLAPPAELKPAPADAALPSVARGETPAARPGALAPAALPVEPPIGRTAETRSPAAPTTRDAPGGPARLAAQAAEGRVATLAPNGTALPANPVVRPGTVAAGGQEVEHYGAAATPPAATATATARAPNAVVALNDLPPDVRATLPRLSVGGAIYSDSASERMLILNGQVYHEGDKPAADTVLEQIRHKSAVLDFRGIRYEITF